MRSSSPVLYLHATPGGAAPRLARVYDAAFVPSPQYRSTLPDVMLAADAIEGAAVPLPQVGVAGFRLPLNFRAAGRPARIHTLETHVTGTVSLSAVEKGINMSRVLRAFYAERGDVFTLARLERVLRRFRWQVGSLEARVRLRFNYPLLQPALRSGLEGYQYHRAALEGTMDEAGRFRRFMEFDFTYASACPCSAELAEHARDARGTYAIPHSQRSVARVRVEVAPGARLAVEDLHGHCLRALRTEVQVMVKREDEQAFAELNGAHVKFVEDAVRLVYAELARDRRIHDFRVACAHFESLHAHDAVAAVAKGLRGGMTADAMEFDSLAT